MRHQTVEYDKKALPMWLVRAIARRPLQRIYDCYARYFPPAPGLSVLDLGVDGNSERPEVHFFEHSYPHPHRVTACGLEASPPFERCYPEVRYVQVQRNEPLPFDDGEFDVVFCNAVIEHVGSRARQAAFLREAARVGRGAFITTPNRWYPVELHTVLPLVHYLPPELHRGLLRALRFDFFAEEDNLNLLDRRAFLAMVPAGRRAQASLVELRFLGLVSNLVLLLNPLGAG